MQLSSILNSSSFSPGILFGILIIVAVLLLSLTLGRTRTLISVLAIYVAFTLQAVFPYFGWLRENASFTNDLQILRILLFFVLYGMVFGLLNRSILKSQFNLSDASFGSVVAMGLAQLGFIVSIILNLAPSFYDINKKVPTEFLPYIGNQQALFFWALIPIGLLIFQKQK